MLTAFGKQPVPVKGACTLYIHTDTGVKPATFQVTDTEGHAILGLETSEELNYITVAEAKKLTPIEYIIPETSSTISSNQYMWMLNDK